MGSTWSDWNGPWVQVTLRSPTPRVCGGGAGGSVPRLLLSLSLPHMSSFWHPQASPLASTKVPPWTSSSLFSGLSMLVLDGPHFPDGPEYPSGQPPPLGPDISAEERCLPGQEHLPWARGWRGRAGCPGWIVRRPWRCKDRRCCCWSCCIWRSCCWKANCWVATCCCCKRSGRKTMRCGRFLRKVQRRDVSKHVPVKHQQWWPGGLVEGSGSGLVWRGQDRARRKRAGGGAWGGRLDVLALRSQRHKKITLLSSQLPTVWKAWAFLVEMWTSRLWNV